MTALRRLGAIQTRYWILAASGWIVLAAMWLPAGTPVRVTAVYLFTLAGAGFAGSALITSDVVERWVLTVALSASLAILVSVAMTTIRNDSMPQRIAVLAAINSVAAVVWGLRAARARLDACDASLQAVAS